jgi:hypothetical protein
LEFPTKSIIDAKRPDSNDHLLGVEERELGSLKNVTPRCSATDISQVDLQPQQGYRAAEAYLRPTPIYTNGRLNSYTFDLKKCTFTMRLIANQTAPHAPSEIYLPDFHFPMDNTSVTVSGGKWEICQLEFHTVKVQYLRWWHREGKAEIKIRRMKCTRGEYVSLQKLHRTRCMMM